MQAVLRLDAPPAGSCSLWTRELAEGPLRAAIRDTSEGVLNVFLRTPGGALSINENADPDVRVDLDAALRRVVAGDTPAAAAARSSLVGVSLDVPVQEGRLALGTWQGLYLLSWAGAGATHEVVATLHRGAGRSTRNVTCKAPSRGCHLVTDKLAGAVPKSDGGPALATFFIKHTSASLSINENADPTVRTDMEAALNHIVPEAWHHEFFRHVEEGPDDMTAHVKSSLVGASVSVPVSRGLQLGTWQGLYLLEHRDTGGFGGGFERQVTVALQQDVVHQTTVTVEAPSRGVHPITQDIVSAAGDALAACSAGVVNVFIHHTSASLTVNAAAAGPGIEDTLNAVVPERWNREFFRHTFEGDDDMPGHVKSTLCGASLTVPIVDGKLGLGKEQEIMLCEHRNMGGWGGRHRRQVTVTVVDAGSRA